MMIAYRGRTRYIYFLGAFRGTTLFGSVQGSRNLCVFFNKKHLSRSFLYVQSTPEPYGLFGGHTFRTPVVLDRRPSSTVAA